MLDPLLRSLLPQLDWVESDAPSSCLCPSLRVRAVCWLAQWYFEVQYVILHSTQAASGNVLVGWVAPTVPASVFQSQLGYSVGSSWGYSIVHKTFYHAGGTTRGGGAVQRVRCPAAPVHRLLPQSICLV